MNVMVLTDNQFLFDNFRMLVQQNKYNDIIWDFYYSEANKAFSEKYSGTDFKMINLKTNLDMIINNYQLVLSLHCKQIFPKDLINKVRCINIHPGFNPYNRGWFPQVFSIINKLPAGITIHEMDDQLDHGPIIIQKQIEILPWETSFDVYKRIQKTEIEMLTIHLRDILDRNYVEKPPIIEGNINTKKDFDKMCEINLSKQTTFGEAIDYFRAMSFKGFKNAYFYDSKGRKIFLEINLEVEEDSEKDE